MMGFAEFAQEKPITFSSVSPHFDYQNPVIYQEVLKHTYDHIISHGHECNGKIVQIHGSVAVNVDVNILN